jgi:hypothetical protein
MTPSVGAKLGKLVKRAPKVSSRQPGGQRQQRGDKGEQHRRRRAEHRGQDDDRDRDTDELADRRGGLLGLVDDGTVARNLDARAGRDPEASSRRSPGVGAQLPGLLVVLDGDEADATITGELARALSDSGETALRDAGLAGDLRPRSVARPRHAGRHAACRP